MAEVKPSRNVIILTSGLSGSSVLAALLAQAGYWPGDETFRKKDYDTWENLDLVKLNKRLLEQVGFTKDYGMAFTEEDARYVAERSLNVDPTPYREFISRCQQRQPWLWKDPRLLLTIDFWRRHMDLQNVDFILVSREPLQAWISQSIRRQVQSPAYCKRYLKETWQYLAGVVRKLNKPLLDLTYEALLVRPEQTLADINNHLSIHLTIADLEGVYRGRLHHRSHGISDFGKACLIYLKNYRERYS